ncbi:MAG: hypothetical protein R3F33_11765 [Planctomycetota bacterium]
MSPSESRSHRLVLGVTGLASVGTGVFWFCTAFIAHHGYGFSQLGNLLLHAALGFVYMLGSAGAHRLTVAIEHRIHPKALMLSLLAGQAGSALLPVVFDGLWAFWTAALTVSLLSSFLWPVVEAYLTGRRTGAELRRATFQFNLVWMSTTMVPMFVLAPWMEENARRSLLLLTVASGLSMFCAVGLGSSPAPHAHGQAPVPSARYRALLRSCQSLLPASYLLLSVVGPLMPYRLERLGIDVERQLPLTATWMVARLACTWFMGRHKGWHGQWSTLLLAATTLVLGFAGVLLAPSLPGLLAAMVLFGVGLGLVYNAGLYYALSVGGGAVEAGGTHEALIGLGYGLGPMIGYFGWRMGGTEQVVLLAFAALGVAVYGASLPWRRERAAARG